MDRDTIIQKIRDAFPGAAITERRNAPTVFHFCSERGQFPFAIVEKDSLAAYSGGPLIRLRISLSPERAEAIIADEKNIETATVYRLSRCSLGLDAADPDEAAFSYLLTLLQEAYLWASHQPQESASGRNSRAFAETAFMGSVHQPKVTADFKLLEELKPPVDGSFVEVLKGLPHPFSHELLFVTELWSSDNISIESYRFYREPLSYEQEKLKEIYDILSNSSSFLPYNEPKRCGGYHADLAFRYQTNTGPVSLLLCFGCDEALFFGEHAQLHTDLDSPTAQRLKDLLRPASL